MKLLLPPMPSYQQWKDKELEKIPDLIEGHYASAREMLDKHGEDYKIREMFTEALNKPYDAVYASSLRFLACHAYYPILKLHSLLKVHNDSNMPSKPTLISSSEDVPPLDYYSIEYVLMGDKHKQIKLVGRDNSYWLQGIDKKMAEQLKIEIYGQLLIEEEYRERFIKEVRG